MRSRICKGEILLDMRQIRKEIKDLKKSLKVDTTGVDEKVGKFINEAMGNLANDVEKCSKDAENVKSIVKLNDGTRVCMNDEELSKFETS